jgi:polysaccharide pyruvyl transferase WcaK-like protein
LRKVKTTIGDSGITQKYLSSYIIDKYFNSLIMKSYSFDGSIFGGHTICGRIYSYIYKYEAFHSAKKTHSVTAPISISKHALAQYSNETSAYKTLKMIKRLKQSLQKFDFIYVRGPYSLRILRDYLGVDEEKIGTALDTGFGAKLLFPEIKAGASQQRKTPRIIIIPRKDYFYYFYRKEGAYKLYLESLAKLILWISKNFDAEICLSPQTISEKHDVLSSEAAVTDLCSVLEKYSVRSLDGLKVFKPKNLINAYSFYSSSDLVISSYMHGGIMALSLGIPAFFILPSMETKVLDVLSFLGLDVKSFFMDMFHADSLKSEVLVNSTRDLLENIRRYRIITELAVNRALPTVEAPVRTLVDLLK